MTDTSTPELAEAPAPTEQMVYCGTRYDDGVLSYRFLDSAGNPARFTPKRAPQLVIGRTYEVPRPTPDTYRLGGAVYVPNAAAHPLTDAWRLTDRSARDRLAADRIHKRLVAENGDIGNLTLDEVARLYTNSRSQDRPAIITAVLRHTQGGFR